MISRSDLSESFLQTKGIHSQWESDYLNPDMDAFYDQAFADIVTRVPITRADHILDAGCGYCFHTRRLAKSGARITAVDFSEAALAEAAKTIAEANLAIQISLQQADLTRLPFERDAFDHIVCWGVLMHVPNIGLALTELARVLKRGGTLVVSEINVSAPDIAIRERFIRWAKRVLGREVSEVRRVASGLEVWTNTADGGLMVRKTDMRWLRSELSKHGLHQTHRTANQFSEAFTNMPSKSLKRFVHQANRLYYRHVRLPQLAAGNILFFSKS